MQPVFRFAPSPNGELHLGHARSALLNQRLARETGGRFLLRVEDIDTERCTPDYEAGIYRDLAWLGISWEEPVRRQSEHFADYAAALEWLKKDGLVYPAFMSRGEVRDHIAGRDPQRWPRDPDGAPLYPDIDRGRSRRERARRVAAGGQHAWRLDMGAALARIDRPLSWREEGAGPSGEGGQVAARPGDWGDVILARSDTPASYHLAVAVDDALQGVTHVVRGRDLFHATAVHRVLQELLGLPAPVYRHHALIADADGRKLSKSRRDTGIRVLREAGVTADEVRRMAEE